MVTIRGYSSCIHPAYSGAVSEPTFTQEDNVEPVSLADMKAYLRIDAGETAFDTEVTELIQAARVDIETYLNRSLINRTINVTMNIANGSAALPFAPVKSLVSITDIDGSMLDSSEYSIKGDVVKTDSYYQVTVTYSAGYEALPAAFKLGIKRLVAFDYEHKGDDSTKRVLGDITGLKKYRRVV